MPRAREPDAAPCPSPVLPKCEGHSSAAEQAHSFFFPCRDKHFLKDLVGASLKHLLFQGLKTPSTSLTLSLQSTHRAFSGDSPLSRCPKTKALSAQETTWAPPVLPYPVAPSPSQEPIRGSPSAPSSVEVPPCYLRPSLLSSIRLFFPLLNKWRHRGLEASNLYALWDSPTSELLRDLPPTRRWNSTSSAPPLLP